MALNSGFFNSLNGDRKYDAEDFGKLFEGIITDGVFNNVGKKFEVTADGNNRVRVDTGRGWKSGVWFENDAPAAVALPVPEVGMNRVDSVVVKIDTTTRLATFEVVKGTPKTGSWAIPSVTSTSTVKRVRLANVRRWPGTSVVTRDHITNTVGDSQTPWITAPLKQVDFSNALDGVQKDLNAWMGQIGDVLSDNAELEIAANLVSIEEKLSLIDSPQNRNNFYRGKNLGTTFTLSQRDAIRTGTFDDLYVGDYWTGSNGVRYIIAHFNYFRGGMHPDSGAIRNKNHIVLIASPWVQTATQMFPAIGDNGYMYSQIRGILADVHAPTVQSFFKNATLEVVSDYAVGKAYRDGRKWTGDLISDKLMLMNELQVYGAHIHAVMNDSNTSRYKATFHTNQFALFRLYPAIKAVQGTWFLRDSAGNGYFSAVTSTGYAQELTPTYRATLRPFFAIS